MSLTDGAFTEWWADVDRPETRYVKTADGIHIAYQVLGDGPVDLLFAPGFASNIDFYWEMPEPAAFLRGLASFSRLILFDHRGAGLSDRMQAAEMPPLEVGMEDIRAVLDAVDSRRPLLFGWQDGGMLCALFVASYPQRALGLVLFSSFARGLWAPDYPWGDTDAEWEEYLVSLEAGWGSVQQAQEFMEWKGSSLRFDPIAVRRQAMYWRLSASPVRSLLSNA